MNYFSHYPYQNFSDYNLDWLLKLVKEVNKKLSEYLENSVITFADPITWDITEQYTALTCVVDTDGTAYLSKRPVPPGVDILNTNYWLPIFNYDDNVNTLRSQIAYNARNSNTTGVALSKGDLVFWNGLIYEVTADMPAGTAFIIGSNIEKSTVDDKIDKIAADTAGDITQLQTDVAGNTADITQLQTDVAGNTADITQLQTDVAGNTEDIAQLNTDLQAEASTRATEDDRLEAMITALKSGVFYNVKDYGILPDSGDVYDKIYDLMHDTVSATGGIVYFPAGKYTVSYTVLIPPNTCFMGDGDSTEIYFDETDTTFGVALASGGSNITIRDMKVNCNSTGQYTAVDPLPGSIGLGNIDFYSEVSKRQYRFEKISCENLKVINVSSDTFYLVQCEVDGPAVKHILYENLRCPAGMVSVMPKEANKISDVVIRGVYCDCLRLGSYYTPDIDCVQVSDVNCTHLRVRMNNIQFNNVFLDNTRTCYCTTDVDSAITVYAGNIYFNNLRGKTDGTQKTFFIYQPNHGTNGNLYLNNAHCEGYNTGLYFRNQKVFVSNTNLTELPTTPYNIGATWATGYFPIDGYSILANPYIYNNFFIWYAVLNKGSGNTIATITNWNRIGRRLQGTGLAFNNAGTKCVPIIVEVSAAGLASFTALGGVNVSDCQRMAINLIASITTT